VCDLRDFDFTYNPKIPKARIWELASGRFVEERASILLCGPTDNAAHYFSLSISLGK
jgi:IstB-like ATP binding protein